MAIPATEGFLRDYSFLRDGRGTMYWVERGPESRIRRRTPDGQIPTLATARFRDVRWMSCTRDGTLYLVDWHDLLKVDPGGTIQTLARGLAERAWFQFHWSERHSLMGVWTDPHKNVYVAVYSGRMVKKITPSGRVTLAV